MRCPHKAHRVPRQHYSGLALGDVCSQSGAQRLAELIRERSVAAGFPLETWIEELPPDPSNPSISKSMWVVRSRRAALPK
jgi:hypothetical protein